MGCAAAFALLAHRLGGRQPQAAIVVFAIVWPTVLIAGQYPFGARHAGGARLAPAVAARAPAGGPAGRGRGALLASPLAFLFLAIVLAGCAVTLPRAASRRTRMRLAAAGVLVAGLGEVVVLRLFPSGGQFPYPLLDLGGVALFVVVGVCSRAAADACGFLAGPLVAYLVASVAVAIYPERRRRQRRSTRGVHLAADAAAAARRPPLPAAAARRRRSSAVAVVGHVVPRLARPRGRPRRAGRRHGVLGALRRLAARIPTARASSSASTSSAPGATGRATTWPPTTSPSRAAGSGRTTSRSTGRSTRATSTPNAYQAWLRSLGVRYVLLPNEQLDYSSRREAEILRSPGHGGLRLVSRSDPNVQVFELPEPTPLLTPATRPGQCRPDRRHAARADDRPHLDRAATCRRRASTTCASASRRTGWRAIRTPCASWPATTA